MNITYRKATIDDVELIVSTRITFMVEAAGEMNVAEKELLIKNNKTYIHFGLKNNIFTSILAFDGQLLVGTSGVCFYNIMPSKHVPNGKIGYIQNMYTIPTYRGKGIATKLFYLTVEEAKKAGCDKVTLTATDMGRPMYEKYGFNDTKNEMSYNWEDVHEQPQNHA